MRHATSPPGRTRLAADPSLEKRASAAARSMALAPQTSLVRGPSDGGAALSAAQRAYFEPRFGWSFAEVRVHADAESARLTEEHDAQALTIGRDIYFGAGRHAPETPAGRELMAHELAHVVQQGSVPGLAGAVQCQPKTPPAAQPAGPTPFFKQEASGTGIVVAKYLVDGIEFRIGITIPDLSAFEKKIPAIAAEITRANTLMTDPALQVKFCVIAPSATTRYGTFHGTPALAVDTNDTDVESIRHEMSHAIFTSYQAAANDPASRFKDTTTAIADLYARLDATKLVEGDEVNSDGRRDKATHPAGLWMVDPPQWSKRATEHPWENPDEFFATARTAFLTDKTALKKSITRFTKIDKAVAKPAAELLTALGALEKAKPAKAPRRVSAEAATALSKVKDPTKIEAAGTLRQALVWALDPSKMPGAPAPATTPATPKPTTP